MRTAKRPWAAHACCNARPPPHTCRPASRCMQTDPMRASLDEAPPCSPQARRRPRTTCASGVCQRSAYERSQLAAAAVLRSNQFTTALHHRSPVQPLNQRDHHPHHRPAGVQVLPIGHAAVHATGSIWAIALRQERVGGESWRTPCTSDENHPCLRYKIHALKLAALVKKVWIVRHDRVCAHGWTGGAHKAKGRRVPAKHRRAPESMESTLTPRRSSRATTLHRMFCDACAQRERGDPCQSIRSGPPPQ